MTTAASQPPPIGRPGALLLSRRVPGEGHSFPFRCKCLHNFYINLTNTLLSHSFYEWYVLIALEIGLQEVTANQ